MRTVIARACNARGNPDLLTAFACRHCEAAKTAAAIQKTKHAMKKDEMICGGKLI